MRLKSLTLKNFKCFREETKFDFGRITVLTGANSSGKSSVIYGILGAIQSGEFPFQFSTNGKYVDMGDFKEIAFGHDEKNEVVIGMELEGLVPDFAWADVSTEKIVHRLSSFWSIDKKAKLPVLQKIEANSGFYSLLYKKKNGKGYFITLDYDGTKDPNSVLSMKQDSKIHRETTILKNWTPFYQDREGELDDLIERHLERIYQNVWNYDRVLNYIGSFRQQPERTYYEQSAELKIERHGKNYEHQIILWELKGNKNLKELTKVIKQLGLLQQIQSKRFEGGRFEIRVKVNSKGVDASLADVGFGVSQFMPIAVADVQLPNDSTLFVSQPETHLHPNIQANFASFLVNRIKGTEKNYVVETHSEYLLNRLRLEIVKGNLKEEDLSVYHLTNNGIKTTAHKIEFKPDGQIKGAPKDFFDTYMIDTMDIALEASK